MSMFDDLVGKLEQGAIAAAKEVAVNWLAEATVDASAFIASSSERILKYCELLFFKKIDLKEFGKLMEGLVDLAEMNALTQAGLAEIEVEKTRNTILKAVTSIAIGAVSKAI